MNPAFSLIKIFVREFYRLNAGFFLLVVGISAGFMRDVEHVAIAEFFISRPYLLLIPISIWTIYAIKVSWFNAGVLKKMENEICYLIPLLPLKNQLLIIFLIVFLQLAPASLYGIFLIGISIKHSFSSATLITTISLTAIHILVSLMLARNVVYFNTEVSISRFKIWFDHHGAKPYPVMILGWMAQTKVWILIGTKLLSCFLLLVLCMYYRNELSSTKLIAIGTIISFSLNIVLLYHYHRFENYYFSLARSLPISISNRIGIFVLNVLILSVAEIGILITSELTFLSSLLFVLLGVSIMVLHHGILFTKDWLLDNLVKRLFYITLAFFMLALSDVPVGLMIVFNILTGIGLWKRYQYSFEYKSPQLMNSKDYLPNDSTL